MPISTLRSVVDALSSNTLLNKHNTSPICGSVGPVGSIGITGYSVSGTTISTGSSVYTTTYVNNTCEYDVLGTKIKVFGFHNDIAALSISIINILGIEAYIEMCKNKLVFPTEITEFLDTQVISHNRNKSIDRIVDSSGYVFSESPDPTVKKYV